MKAIILPEYNANIIRAMRSLEVGEMAIPEARDEQVLIKVLGAPCNPSDIAFMRGGYGIRKPVPVAMGFECTGVVIETGPDPAARALLGKKVSCFSQDEGNGTWAEYFLTHCQDCLILNEELPMEQAATLCINPFTAYALVDMAWRRKVPAIIQNGASGQIGIFIRRLAARKGIKIINLVRKDEHVQVLEDQGEAHVLSMNNSDFAGHLEKAAGGFKALLAFDAAGGDTSGMILNAMPPGAELVIYGGLSGKPAGMFDTLDIIFKGKTIRGFNLGEWKQEIGADRFSRISEEIQQMIIEGIIQTKIQGVFRLEEVQQALEQYIRNMSAGKILFTP